MATTEELIKQAGTVPATDRSQIINDMYDAQKDATLAGLESAYNQNMAAAQAAKDAISPQYQTAANDLATQYERNRRNFNTQAAASGLNTGTGSQAKLAQQSNYLRDFGNLRASESEALAEADRGMTNLTTQYQNATAQAANENDFNKMSALYKDYLEQYDRDMQQAQTLANYGDFSMYAKVYGDEAAANMKSAWIASNPELAYNMGQISASQYHGMTGKWPAGYSTGGGTYYKQPATGLTEEEKNLIAKNEMESLATVGINGNLPAGLAASVAAGTLPTSPSNSNNAVGGTLPTSPSNSNNAVGNVSADDLYKGILRGITTAETRENATNFVDNFTDAQLGILSPEQREYIKTVTTTRWPEQLN